MGLVQESRSKGVWSKEKDKTFLEHCRKKKRKKPCASHKMSLENQKKMDVGTTVPNPTEELGLWESGARRSQ